MIDYMPSVNHQQLGNINKHEHAVNMESSAPWSHLDFDPDKVMLTRSWCQCVAITVHFTFWNAFRPEERSAASVSQSVINTWQHRDAEMLSSACKMFNRNYRQQDGTHPKTHMKQTNIQASMFLKNDTKYLVLRESLREDWLQLEWRRLSGTDHRAS